MAKSSQIKKLLKSEGLWKEYKTKFAHKQMRFVFTELADIYAPSAHIGDVLKAEKVLLSTPKGPDMFELGFHKLETLPFYKDENKSTTANWNAFAKYLWFQYQTSTYWKDSKKGIKNIYTEKTFVKINSEKREFYQQWVNSLDKTRETFNNDLIRVLKKVS